MAQEPKVLGHYRIERTLGKGAMGVVYEGLDLRLHRKVAIKTIIKAGQGDTLAQEYTTRFLREAQAVARLNHPNIVHVYDFGEDDDVSYIVMELINGRDLKSVLEAKERFELKETLRVICELLDGLDFAHAAGVVHRDIKPANMMFDAQRRVKLTDFGVARLTDVERTRVELTQAGTMVGTPAYMSPEQVQGLTVDHRTDIFSAGVVLYQLLTGQKPFEGGAFTVAKRIVESEPPPPSAYERSISPELDRVVARALAKQPDQRFSRAKEFAQALHRIFDHRPSFASDEDATVIAPPRPMTGDPPPTRPESTSSTRGGAAGHGNEADVEFWRTIKDSNDVEDLDFYVQRFPDGIYVDLAKRKIAKLKQGGGTTRPSEEASRGRNLDEEFWRGVKDSDDAEELEMYTERFPQGMYVELAKRRIAKLRGGAAGDEGSLRGRNLDEELWRGVRDSTDIADIEHYLDRFPQGLYVDLARRKVAKLRGAPGSEDSSAIIRRPDVEAGRKAEEERLAAEKSRQEAEAKAKREGEEKARKEAEAAKAKQEADEKARKEAESAKAKRESEEKARKEAEAAKAKQEAEEKARKEAEAAKAKREAEEKARKEAEAAKAKQEADEKARKEAEAAKAKREAEEKEKARQEAEAKAKREAEARRESEERARRDAEERAKREAEEKARRDAEAKAKRESEENARKLAEAKAQREAEEKAKREAAEKAKREAEKAKRDAENRARVGLAATSDAVAAPVAEKPEGKSPAGLIIGGLVALAVVGGGAYFMFKPKPEAAVTPAATPSSPPVTASPPPSAAKPPPAPVVEPPKKTEEAAAPKPVPVPAPAPPPEKASAATPSPAAAKEEAAKREAETREAAKRAAETRARLEAAEKAKRTAEEKVRGEANAKEAAKLEEERKAAQGRMDEERKKLREEEQRLNEMRKKNEEALQKQRQDAERAKVEAEKAEKAREQEKKKAPVFVPPTF